MEVYHLEGSGTEIFRSSTPPKMTRIEKTLNKYISIQSSTANICFYLEMLNLFIYF